MHLDMSDEEMVQMALRDKAFFGHLVMRYEERLSRYVTRLGVRNKEDNEDVLQEIFIKVYKNINGFDTSLSFSSWIYRIAHNEAISWYRKRNVRPEGHLVNESEDIISFVSTEELDAETLFDQEINAGVLSEALNNLDQKYRDPLILRFFEHKEYDEISDILKIPSGTVGTLIHRGKKALKNELNIQELRI